MGFVAYEKGSSPAPTVPSATIQKRGLISLNRASVDMLRADHAADPEGVELLYDDERKIIGIRAARLDEPNAYPLRAQGGKTVGPFLIAGTMFTRFIGLETSDARRWTPRMEGELLCIDLNSPSAKVASRRRAAQQDPEGHHQGPSERSSTPGAPS